MKKNLKFIAMAALVALCSCGKPQILYDLLQKIPAFLTERTVLFDEPVVHGGITEYIVCSKPSFLNLSGFEHSGSNIGSGFAGLSVHQLTWIDGFHHQLYVYSVHKRPRKFG